MYQNNPFYHWQTGGVCLGVGGSLLLLVMGVVIAGVHLDTLINTLRHTQQSLHQQQKILKDPQSKHFYPQDRQHFLRHWQRPASVEQLKAMLQRWQQELGFQELILSHNQGHTQNHVSSLSLKIHMKMLFDEAFFKLLNKLIHAFPGQVSINRFLLYQEKELTQHLLYEIAHGKRISLCQGEIIFDWREITHEKNEHSPPGMDDARRDF